MCPISSFDESQAAGNYFRSKPWGGIGDGKCVICARAAASRPHPSILQVRSPSDTVNAGTGRLLSARLDILPCFRFFFFVSFKAKLARNIFRSWSRCRL